MPETGINRHDLLLLFEVTNGNPNGDPDSGNMPRVDPATGLGLVSDVCLKRKVRNFVESFPPKNGSGCNILIRQGAVIEPEQKKAEDIAVKENPKSSKSDQARAARDWLCQKFYDVRTFGQVISTGEGVMKGSVYGQIRGPVQFTFGRSFDPITPLEVTITRCAVTKESEADKQRTMGQKFIVPYGLYAAKCYVSPKFARDTQFSQGDYDLLIDALKHLFDHDRSASRGDMVVRGLFDFEHVGTQSDKNGEQNRREAELGCAHAHKLFEKVRVELKDKSKPPSRFADYQVEVPDQKSMPAGVVLHVRVDPRD